MGTVYVQLYIHDIDYVQQQILFNRRALAETYRSRRNSELDDMIPRRVISDTRHVPVEEIFNKYPGGTTSAGTSCTRVTRCLSNAKLHAGENCARVSGYSKIET